MHYGVLGMKWGVRRYQNKDGTLTDAGKKKYTKWRDKRIKKAERGLKRNERYRDEIVTYQREKFYNALDTFGVNDARTHVYGTEYVQGKSISDADIANYKMQLKILKNTKVKDIPKKISENGKSFYKTSYERYEDFKFTSELLTTQEVESALYGTFLVRGY